MKAIRGNERQLEAESLNPMKQLEKAVSIFKGEQMS
jgi:hypothetical protein